MLLGKCNIANHKGSGPLLGESSPTSLYQLQTEYGLEDYISISKTLPLHLAKGLEIGWCSRYLTDVSITREIHN